MEVTTTFLRVFKTNIDEEMLNWHINFERASSQNNLLTLK